MREQFISHDIVCFAAPFWGASTDEGFVTEPAFSVSFEKDTNPAVLSNERFRAYQPCSDYSNTTSNDLLVLSNENLCLHFTRAKWVRNFKQMIDNPSLVATPDYPAEIPSQETIPLGSVDSLLNTQPEICVTETARLFMDSMGLNSEIDNIVQILITNYLTLKAIVLDVKHDPEITNRKYLRFTLAISGKPSDILEQEQNYRRMVYDKLGTNIFELLTINYRWS